MLGAILNTPDDLDFGSKKPWLPITVAGLIVVGVLIYIFGDQKPESADETPLSQPSAASQQPAAVSPSPTARPIEGGVLARARALDTQGNLIEARIEYLNWWHQSTNMAPVPEVETRMAEINMTLLMNCAPLPENVSYIIQKGDSISAIGERFSVTKELTQKRNQIADPLRLQVGDDINVFTGRFSVVVSKARNDLIVFMNGTFWKRYTVSTGQYGKTPPGTYEIATKEINPDWWANGRHIPYTGDPAGENILGTRWMSIKATGQTPDAKGYGLHGTWDDSSLGKALSAGCVRMRNADVEELFMLLPLGAPVTIEN